MGIGWHWRYDIKGKPHRIGLLVGNFNNTLFEIPLLNRLWIKY